MIKSTMMLLPALALCLSGCSVTGLGGKSSFSCGAPEGSNCRSLDQVYDIASSGESLPATKTENTPLSDNDKSIIAPKSRFVHGGVTSGMPIRSEPVVMRIAMFPWSDADGVLHDISYQYVTLSTGDWLIEHNKANLRTSVFSPLAPKPAPIVGDK